MSTASAVPNNGIEDLMSEREFLQRVKISRAQLNIYKSKKLITYFKVGRRVLYDTQSLEDFKTNCARRIEASPHARKR
jgi:hypothetical protein